MSSMGMPPNDYDGGAEFWARSSEQLMAVFTDPEYLEKVVPDEKHFLVREESLVLIGHDEVKLDST